MKEKVTCYSDGEGALMHLSQTWRAELLRPLLERLKQVGLRANHITLAGLLSGLAFCPALLLGYPNAALAFILLHVLLDGLDGPLARFRGEASNRGSFVDTMADQAVVTASTLALIEAGFVSIWPGGLYLFFYAIVVGFAMVRNALAAPYSWLFRPRFLVFAWIGIELYLWPGSLEVVLWIAAALLAMKAVTGFITIGKRI